MKVIERVRNASPERKRLLIAWAAVYVLADLVLGGWLILTVTVPMVRLAVEALSGGAP